MNASVRRHFHCRVLQQTGGCLLVALLFLGSCSDTKDREDAADAEIDVSHLYGLVCRGDVPPSCSGSLIVSTLDDDGLGQVLEPRIASEEFVGLAAGRGPLLLVSRLSDEEHQLGIVAGHQWSALNELYESGTRAVAISPSGAVATATSSSDEASLRVIGGTEWGPGGQVFRRRGEQMMGVAFVGNEDVGVLAADPGGRTTLEIFSTAGGSRRHELETGAGTTVGFAGSHTGYVAITWSTDTVGDEPTTQVLDLRERPPAELPSIRGWTALAWSPSGDRLLLARYNGEMTELGTSRAPTFASVDPAGEVEGLIIDASWTAEEVDLEIDISRSPSCPHELSVARTPLKVENSFSSATEAAAEAVAPLSTELSEQLRHANIGRPRAGRPADGFSMYPTFLGGTRIEYHRSGELLAAVRLLPIGEGWVAGHAEVCLPRDE